MVSYSQGLVFSCVVLYNGFKGRIIKNNYVKLMDYVASTTTLITDLVSNISSVLFAGLGSVLGIVGVLIGLFFVVKLARNYISGAKS